MLSVCYHSGYCRLQTSSTDYSTLGRALPLGRYSSAKMSVIPLQVDLNNLNGVSQVECIRYVSNGMWGLMYMK